MAYIFLTFIVVFLSVLHDLPKSNKNISRFMFICICLALCIFAAMRSDYNDTPVYISEFVRWTQKQNLAQIWIGRDFAISNVYLYRTWNWFIYTYVTQNYHVWLGLCSAVYVIPCVFLIRKYSKSFSLSMFIFMTLGPYLFSLAALKQCMAIGIMAIGIDAFINKKWRTYYICCALTIGFHTYAIVFLLLPLLGRDLWNARTKIICTLILLLGISLSRFAGTISSIIDMLGKDVSEETLTSGAVNLFRVLVHLVPLILCIISAKSIRADNDLSQEYMIKFGILTSIFMVLAAFGNPIAFGRIPYYFMIGEIISIPYLLRRTFSKLNYKFVCFVAVACYAIFCVYTLYTVGAFEEDIFKFGIHMN